MKKRAQIELSFGMIFSIILIIVFLGFAFYAIKTFLNFQDQAKAGRFYDSLQSDIDRIFYNSEFSSENQSYVVPSYARFVCFIDFPSGAKGPNSGFYSELKIADHGDQNIAFYPVKINNFESKEILHLDTSKITNAENPFCLKVSNGKVSLTLKKDFGEALITIGA
jgi:hypothetical protein